MHIHGVATAMHCAASSSEPRVVCYYTNWSVYRPGTARFNPQNINPYLCTHLIYAFGGFTKDNTLKPFDKYQDIEKGGYAKFTGLKTYNKNLKTMLAIGGWNEGSTRFSPMDYTIKYYLENGADRDKLVLGIPTYGRSYTLFNADAICEALKSKKTKRAISSDDEESDEESSEEEAEDEPWTVVHPNPSAMGPVAYKGNQSTDNAVVERPKSSGSSSRRRNRPTTSTARPAAKAKTNNRKSGSSNAKDTTPTWTIATPEPPTTPDPGADFKCKDEGFFQHPRDCKKYFWCLDSGPSNLGIVAHQFTCLFFNKAADSCDFARNVLCKIPSSTTAAPTTKAASTTTTTRKPVKLSTKSSAEYEDDVEDSVDVDAEDPKVLKELIDLIKKVGGVEQLEKQLHLSDSSSDGAITTTPSSFNKNLYKKVLERTIARSKQGSNNIFESGQSRQRGPQNAGLAATADNDKLLRKDRPQNALFERPASFVAVSDTPESLDIQSARRENIPEYVTIRRQRPTTEETTTAQYQLPDPEEESQETILEKEISSPSLLSQPQYTSIVRSRSTTSPPSEEPDTPEPTTVLSVQISSLLNSPEAETSPEPISTTEITEPPTTTTTTTTTAAPSSASTRRTILRRRGSTTTPTSTAVPSTTQVSSRNYTFVRRRRPVARPNEITSDSDETAELNRKIRSTTPDSREINGARAAGEVRPIRRFRSRLQSSTDDSIPAEASTIPRGQFRPHLEQDEIISLTPVDFNSDDETPTFVSRQSFTSRRFRGRTSTTLADRAQDSEVSAATLDVRRPSFLSRGRGRFTVSSTTEGLEFSTSEATVAPRRPAFARFTPRPFSRSTTPATTADDDTEENVDEIVTKKTPPKFSFTRLRPSSSTAEPIVQAQRVSFPSRQSSTQQTLTSDVDEEEQDKNEDITLSESAIEEKEHEDLDANEEEEETSDTPKGRIVIKRLRTPSSSTAESTVSTETIPINDLGKRKFRVIRRRPTSTPASEVSHESATEPSTPITPRNKIRKVIRKKIKPAEDEPGIIAKSIDSLNSFNQDTSTEILTNYGEKTRPSLTSSFTEAPIITTRLPKKEAIAEVIDNNKEDEYSEKEEEKINEEVTTENQQTGQSYTKEETPEEVSSDNTNKPDVLLETSQKAIDLSENDSQPSIEPSSESPTTEVEEPSPETTTTSTTPLTSPSSRSRAPYRPAKRIFTSTTESSSPLSSRTFSRKFNPGVYTSPATVDRDTIKPSSRRPFPSRTFTRRPFSTSTTTPEPEDEEFSEEILDVEPEEELVLVPPSKLFTRKPDLNDDDFQDSEEALDDETSEEDKPTTTSKKPYKPRVVNSNTFRTSTSTTELPKRFGTSQNRTSIYNRSSPNKPVDPKSKRVQNVPTGYNRPVTLPATETETETAKSESSETTNDVTEESTSTNASTDFDMSTGGDDYLSMTEISGTTLTDIAETLSTNTIQYETATEEMEIDNNSDDFLEYTEQTTNYPSTHDTTFDAQTETENIHQDTEGTTKSILETTIASTAAPIIKTQFDKLFSVSRVVEVSSKLDKHRLNKNNESRLIEEGKIMIEKKPMVDKIGEVSRFSLIKIVEDEIPIYLTKYGHIYPVENPPDNPIRIDEGRNARALSNFAEGPRENLVASESINEAYRHVTKEANKPSNDIPKHRVEHIQSDDFLSYINDDKKLDKSSENAYPQWQFVPAAYENEQNKAAKSFEIITPRSMLTNPSTLPLEALFKTENPKMAKKISDEKGSQPFVVYSASVPTQNEEANIVKVEVLKPEVGRSIVTFAKGQEFQGASVDHSTIQYPINITILPKTSTTSSATTTVLTTSTEKTNTSPIIELLTTQPTTVTTETEVTTTEIPSTTETMPEEVTTVKISPLDSKRKFAFPRRPIIKPSNLTRVNPVPRTSKKINATVVTNILKSNKTSGFNPSNSRFTANRAQNVPVDFRKKGNTPKVAPKVAARNITTEAPRTTTERKLYFKPIRPNLRPAFVPRKSTTAKRRTKATSAPDTTDTETEPIDTETTTNKYTRRGNNKFKSRKEALNAGRTETKKNEIEIGTRRPSLSGAARSERPTRNFVRRRPGGANATTPLPSPSEVSSTAAPAASRRPFRVASRRRPAPATTSTTQASAQASTAGLASEESLQDIGDTDSIEDPALVTRATPKTSVKIQRRPLVSLKDEARDQNPSATNEEERKRQSKKYSSSIKQNQLEELKTRGQETTTAGSTAAEDYSAETAVAIAAHQLLIAPVPNIPNYDEESEPAKKSTGQTISDYSYTSPQYPDFTDSKTVYSEEFPSTTNFESSSLKNYISTSTGAYDDTTTFIPKTTYNSPKPITTPVYLTLSRSPLSTPSVVSQGISGSPSLGPSTAQYPRGDEYQYLAPVTTPQTPRRQTPKTVQRKISTTLPPTLPPVTTPKPRRVPSKNFQKPFEKIPAPAANTPNKPIENYDYYDDGEERKTFPEETKVVLHEKGVIECLDIGNFPHPSSCKKFISCARIDNGSLLGWEYICPKGLSFDPVGGICNWSAGLGCSEKDM
ncbi:hypothetical protein MSG28_010491 [Choristoneura fumiferana]|uniref:Uncharacterized protein n=1 Tax=Choristoneura fumiferana TaxID=7141 RepID=A0ACC0KLK7_CHOFU|nr:hypothetical protein MSG28_010491 [Choristoneura fumiferana]